MLSQHAAQIGLLEILSDLSDLAEHVCQDTKALEPEFSSFLCFTARRRCLCCSLQLRPMGNRWKHGVVGLGLGATAGALH